MKEAAPEGVGQAHASITIRRLPEMAAVERLMPALDAIFFEASGRTFVPAPERAAFRERWLGRYLDLWPEHFHVALAGNDVAVDIAPIGYLAGCLANPARSGDFGDISYFADFAAACDRFPAHLHINLAPTWRSQGHGAALIEAFADHAAAHGAPGMHVVTGRDARNVAFYRARGFAEVASLGGDHPRVFLGRRLGSPPD